MGEESLLLEILASVRHLEGVVASLKKEVAATRSKEENKDEKRVSFPAPILPIKEENKEEISLSLACAKKFVFKKPTVEEIQAYLDKLGETRFRAEEFFDTYEASGWRMKNGQKMRDWKAKVRSWCNIKNRDETDEDDVEGFVRFKKRKNKSPSSPMVPHVGHVEVNRPKILDEVRDTQGGIQRYNELRAQGYTPEQIAKMVNT